MKTQVIIPAAGVGSRLKADVLKQFILLKDRPLFIHTLEIFEQCSSVDSVVLVAHEQSISEFERLVKQYNITKISNIVAGGETRCVSVSNGLKVISDDTECVIIHDAARPFASFKIVEQAISLCYDEQAVIVGVPVKSTIKRVCTGDKYVEKTIDRNTLWEVQTPQVFRKDIIIKAHEQSDDINVTDDSMLVERLGVKVKMLEGDYRNIKVTTEEDLIFARSLLEE